DHALEGALDRERERDATAPGTDVRDDTTPPASRIPHPGLPQHQINQPLGLRSRDQGPRVELQVERADARAADGVREGNAARTLLHRVPEPLNELHRGFLGASQPHVARIGPRTGYGSPPHHRLATAA